MAKQKKVKAGKPVQRVTDWAARVEAGLTAIDGKGRLSEIAAKIKLPEGYPKLHFGSNKMLADGKTRGKSSLPDTVFQVLNAATNSDRFRKVAPGEYDLLVKKVVAAAKPAKNAKAQKKAQAEKKA